jgi:phospholipid/cholesterol/gamma-HCH transport system permease protein
LVSEPGLTERASDVAQSSGAAFLDVAETVGGMGLMLAAVVKRVLKRDIDWLELSRLLYKMGVQSVPIVVVTALFTGAIMVVQAAPLVTKWGAQGLLGWAAGFVTLREIGPLLTALMLSGRGGANNAAELGTMVVTEQLDALRALSIEPVSFLLVPRVLGIVLTLFVSTVFSDALALIGAAGAGFAILGVHPRIFYQGITGDLLTFGDMGHGLIKSVLFGVIIALSSCRFGITTSGGAPGVGRAVVRSVVVSATGIFAVDYLLSFAIG